MSGYSFHPAARADLEEIGAFIRTDSLAAADAVVGEILRPFADWSRFRLKAIDE